MKNELISVIVPVYNVEKYLKKCIDSIICQTYENIEIILIDDGSTDSSSKICDKYLLKDSRIKVIHQKNQGIAIVRNKGLAQSNGKYIFWVDSDDYISNECIEYLYNLLKKENADMSICNYLQGSSRLYDFNSNEDYYNEIMNSKKALEYIYESDHYAFIMAASWAKLIKKELYDNLKYPENKLFEDIYMSHHLINNCNKIAYTNKVMYYYFQWNDSILGKKLHRGKLDYLYAFEERIHFFEELQYLDLKEKARLQYLHALMWEYSRSKDILNDKEMTKSIVKQYRKYYKIGTSNTIIKHETKWYMFKFYVSPYGTEIIDKIKSKLLKKGN